MAQMVSILNLATKLQQKLHICKFMKIYFVYMGFFLYLCGEYEETEFHYHPRGLPASVTARLLCALFQRDC